MRLPSDCRCCIFPRAKERGWWQSTVIEVLRDPLYKGDGYFNRTGPTDAQQPCGSRGFKDQRPGNQRGVRLRPQEEWVLVPVPIIIDPETWQTAQAQLVLNRQRSTRNNIAQRFPCFHHLLVHIWAGDAAAVLRGDVRGHITGPHGLALHNEEEGISERQIRPGLRRKKTRHSP